MNREKGTDDVISVHDSSSKGVATAENHLLLQEPTLSSCVRRGECP